MADPLTDLVVRSAAPGDLEALDALERSGWPPRTTPRDPARDPPFSERFPLAEVLVCVDAGAGVWGYAALGRRSALPTHRHVGQLRSIVVHPQARRRGVGARLLEACETLARERGCQKLALSVLATNEPAVRFYQRRGYALEGRLAGEFVIDGEPVDDLLMAKWL